MLFADVKVPRLFRRNQVRIPDCDRAVNLERKLEEQSERDCEQSCSK